MEEETMKKLICREVCLDVVIEFYEDVFIDEEEDMTYYLLRLINRNDNTTLEKRFNLRSGEEKNVRCLIRIIELVIQHTGLYINPRLIASLVLSFINQIYPLHVLNKRAIVKMIESVRAEGR